MDEIDMHAWRVGRIAIAAAQLEADAGLLIYVAKRKSWDNSDLWTEYAERTWRIKSDLAEVAQDFGGMVAGLDAVVDRLSDLLVERNTIVHAFVRYSFFETDENGLTIVRENPFEPQMMNPKSRRARPLPTPEEIDDLEGRLQNLGRDIRGWTLRIAAAAGLPKL